MPNQRSLTEVAATRTLRLWFTCSAGDQLCASISTVPSAARCTLSISDERVGGAPGSAGPSLLTFGLQLQKHGVSLALHSGQVDELRVSVGLDSLASTPATSSYLSLR